MDDRNLLAALVGDGRSLLSVTALALLFSGAFALYLTATGRFLPHDTDFLQMSAAELCRVAGCRINAFMFHDRAAFGGSLIAVGVLYLWLAEFPLRSGRKWAWWTFAVTGATGFLSFLAYLGYGYLDSWHGTGTAALLPLFVAGLIVTWRRLPRHASKSAPRGPLQSGVGRWLLLATAAGMAIGGGTILLIGMTSVFVPEDLQFIGVSANQLRSLNPRLVPLIAHDRAGFGGGLLTTGLLVGACVYFSEMTRSLRQALWLAGMAGFGCAIGVHLVVGYTAARHLAPAVAGAAIFASGMVLGSRQSTVTDLKSDDDLGAVEPDG